MRRAAAASTWPGAAQRLQLPECRANPPGRSVSAGIAWGWSVRCGETRTVRVHGIVLSEGPEEKRVSHVVLNQKGDQHHESPNGHWSLQVTQRVERAGPQACGIGGSGLSPPGSELGRTSGFIRNLIQHARKPNQGKGATHPETHSELGAQWEGDLRSPGLRPDVGCLPSSQPARK